MNLKIERVWQRDYANHEEAAADVADYIVGFYNCVRLHSKLGNLPPNAFSNNWQLNNVFVYPKKLDHYTPALVCTLFTHCEVH